jgi:LPXTG-motif cell wall-anchored protein
MAKKSKRLLSLLLVIVLIVSLAITAGAAIPSSISISGPGSVVTGQTINLTTSLGSAFKTPGTTGGGYYDTTHTVYSAVTYEWNTSNATVATLTSGASSTAVTGASTGNANITVTATQTYQTRTRNNFWNSWSAWSSDTIAATSSAKAITVTPPPVPTVTINSGAASVTVDKGDTRDLTAASSNFITSPSGQYRVVYSWASDNANVTFTDDTGSTATVRGVGGLNSSATITVTATQQHKAGSQWVNDAVTATDTIIVNVIQRYDHVDVEMNGTQVIRTQNPDASYTDKTYNIVVTNPAVKINNGDWDNSPSSTSYSGAQREFRFTGLNFDSTATVYIQCDISATNVANPTDTHTGHLSLVYTATTGFVEAFNACPGHSGLDFTITDSQVIDSISYDVNYVWTGAPATGVSKPVDKTYLQGNDVVLDTNYSAGEYVEIGSDNYTFSGWFTNDTYTTAAANINDIAADVTFYGYWTKTTDPVPTYNVKYIWTDAPSSESKPLDTTHPEGDDVVLDTNYSAGEYVEIGSDNYTFSGWFTNDTYTTAAADINDISADVTFYGYWTITTDPTNEPTPDFATLRVTKQVSGSNTSDAFEIQVVFNYEGEATPDILASGTGEYISNGNTFTLSLQNGEYIDFNQILYGTDYTVTEITPLTAGWSKSGETSGSFYNEDDENINYTDSVFIVNTFTQNEQPVPPPPPVVINTASLTITKTVSGDVADAPADSFEFTVTFTPGAPDFWNVLGISAPAGATGSNGTYTFSLSAGQSIAFSNIPVGTTYSVVETTVLADGWTAGTATGATGSIGATGAAATIDNVYTVQEVAGASDEPSDAGTASDNGGAVAGDVDVLPQTGGISSSTLLGIFGLALIAIGGTAFTILRKKADGKSKSK